jgi:hypothetical protein
LQSPGRSATLVWTPVEASRETKENIAIALPRWAAQARPRPPRRTAEVGAVETGLAEMDARTGTDQIGISEAAIFEVATFEVGIATSSCGGERATTLRRP